MAAGLYDKGREGILGGDIQVDTDTIKCLFLDAADDTRNLATDQFLSDVASAARVGTPQTLTSKTITNGVFDAADAVFTGLTGDQSEEILIYQDTGVEGTSRLIANIDGLTLLPNGGNVTIVWDNGANKIFRF